MSHGFYRSRTNTMFFGICGALAEKLDVNAGGLRLLTAAAIVMTGILPGFLVYVLLGLTLKPEPIEDALGRIPTE